MVGNHELRLIRLTGDTSPHGVSEEESNGELVYVLASFRKLLQCAAGERSVI
jgi:hypothetical protein